MNRAPDEQRAKQIAKTMDDAFGHWLAGFIDGEGCFYIQRLVRNARPSGPTYACGFRLNLRADERPILEEVQRRTGIGAMYGTYAPNRGRPMVIWDVRTKADVLALVGIVDRFPLRAKKARDYAIWREAVLLWWRDHGKRAPQGGPSDWSAIAALRDQLQAVRAYVEPDHVAAA